MFSLFFAMNNAAFEDMPEREAARILRDLANGVENGALEGKLKDANGNTVGEFHFNREC